MQTNDVMNAGDVARYLGLGKNKVYQLAKSGELASYQVGRKLRFALADVELYIASTHREAKKTPAQSDGATAAFLSEASALGAGKTTPSEAASFGIPAGSPFIIAGEDAPASIVASSLCAAEVPAVHALRGSYTALVNLYAGDVDAAVVSLYDQRTNTYNLPFVRDLAPGASVAVFRLCARERGLIVRAGNPGRMTSWGALLNGGVRLCNRVKGSASRVLLDEKLRALEARSETIEGYDAQEYGGQSAARRVAQGLADVTVGTRREAAVVEGVTFVPLQAEWIDIAVAKNERTRPLIRALKTLLVQPSFAEELKTQQVTDLSRVGTVVYEC